MKSIQNRAAAVYLLHLMVLSVCYQAGGAHFFAEDGTELSPEEQKRLKEQSLKDKRGHVEVEATYRHALLACFLH